MIAECMRPSRQLQSVSACYRISGLETVMIDQPQAGLPGRFPQSDGARRHEGRPLLCAVALVGMLLLVVSSGFASEGWTEVRSEHFTVITDAGAAKGREVAKRFEQTRIAFQLIFQGMKVTNPVPLQIFALSGNKLLKRVGPMWKGRPGDEAGFFMRDGDRCYIVFDLTSFAGWEVVIHEYMHLLLNTNLPPIPAWFDEGFAEYFSTLRFEGKKIYYGAVKPSHIETLKSSPWMRCVVARTCHHVVRCSS